MNKLDHVMELTDGLELLARNGYKCYLVDGRGYGYIVTPSKNILYIQHDYFDGWRTSFQYVPSAKNGSGCGCEEEGFEEITVEQIEKSEKEGFSFALELKATLYTEKQIEAYFANYWEKEKLIEIKGA